MKMLLLKFTVAVMFLFLFAGTVNCQASVLEAIARVLQKPPTQQQSQCFINRASNQILPLLFHCGGAILQNPNNIVIRAFTFFSAIRIYTVVAKFVVVIVV